MSYYQQLLILCPLIFLSGFVDSIAGGGGLISLTAYYMAGLPPHMALGSNKMSASIGTLTSSIRFFLSKSYYKKSLLSSVAAALGGAALGAQLALFANEKVLRMVLIVAVPCIAAFILLKKDFDDTDNKKELSDRKIILICAAVSFGTGIYDGFFGPGTGTFLIIAHMIFANLTLKESMGNSKIINLATNAASLAVFLTNGKIMFSLAIPAAFFAIAGNYVGTGLALKSGKKIVRPIMVAVLGLLVVKLIYDMTHM